MAKPGAASEPSMEEILASIRQIISDDSEHDDGARHEAQQQSDDAGPVGEAETGEEVLLEPGVSGSDGHGPQDEAGDADSLSAAAEDPEAAAGAEHEAAVEAEEAEAAAEAEHEAAVEAEEGEPAEEPQEAEEEAAEQEQADEDETEAADEDADDPEADDAETQESQTVTNTAKQIEDQSEQPGYGHHLLSRDSDEAVSGAFSALAHTILAQNARTLEDLVSEMLQPMLKEWLDENLPQLVERMVRQEIERVSGVRR